ncbi:MAG: UDP-N-acetylmuramoyl-L-alanine--D-glutamate ligase [Rhodospirillales bacterium]|jgi:UDP-N-acetylmuramoylalanine--D-glutamate ligase|nr:UDP-N-acetylmuramoyl-L-alanine--D-glutamate ligase [Rhodospirillales bacterium]
MIPVSSFADRSVAVVGLGRSGLATARALAMGGARVWAWDDNERARSTALDEGFDVFEPAPERMAGTSAVVLSPGIPLTHPTPHPVVALAREAGCPVIGDIELLARSQPKASYIGITGTNGKSTTTSLVGHILSHSGRKVETGGNLGAPALGLAEFGAEGVYVLELSSYQLDLLDEATFDIAVLINISPDHLDRHGGMDGYVAAKRRIFRSGDSRLIAIVGVDDRRSAEIFADLSDGNERRVIPISIKGAIAGGVYVVDGELIDDQCGAAEPVLDLKGVANLPGEHNWQNAAAGYAAARAAGIARDDIVAAIKTYPGLAHRQETVATVDGITFVNDSKATNGEAAARALDCYENVYWIAGGLAKEGGLDPLEGHLSPIRHAFLIGEAREDFANSLSGKCAVSVSGTLDVAVHAAFEAATMDGLSDAIVLLSPACASFDQFSDFEARGDAFKRLVSALPGSRREARS